MKVNAITLRQGNIIEHNNKLYVVLKNESNQPGKGGSVSQVEVRDVRNGNKDNLRFRTQESVEKVRLEQEEYQFLYKDNDGINLMHQVSFEQITLGLDVFGDQANYLQEGMIVEVETYEEEPLAVKLPDTVVFEITEAEPVIKGQTATTSFKPATLTNGARVMVPPYVEVGTHIVIRTEDGSYVERAKN